MLISKEDLVTVDTINISASMFMYGTVGVTIGKSDSGIYVSWIGIADGGDVIVDEEKIYSQKSFNELVEKILPIDFVVEESSDANFEWSVSIEDSEEKVIFDTQVGYWDVSTLFSLRDIIVDYIVDDEPFELLVDMIGC